MSDCGANALKRPVWGDTEWKALPGGGEAHGPASIDLHAVEVALSDGTGRTRLLPLERGVTVVGVKLDGERYVRAGAPDWDDPEVTD